MRPLRLAAFILALTFTAAACTSSSADDVSFPQVVTLGKGEVFAQINNHGLGVGDNRVSLGLTDKDGNKILDAAVRLQFYDLNASKPQLRSETDATFVPVELSYIDEQSRDNKRTAAGSDGAYIAHATFDEPGDWGVKITVTRAGETLDPIPFRFNVLERTPEPAIGEAASPSRQVTLADVADVAEIDSSSPPRPTMHDITIADALGTGKPLVVAFATPAFCTSRTCAPIMDTVMDPLAAKYADRAVFVHVEPYDLAPLRQSNVQQPVRAAVEWRIQTEPWIFVVGKDGKIAAKFEGIASQAEVESALTTTLAASSSP